MISHEYKCIFIHIPKCAGTSIETVLGHLDNHEGRGGQDHRSIRMLEKPLIMKDILSSEENILELLRRFNHILRSNRNYRNKFMVTKKQFDEYYKFTLVRNPWSRAFSCYQNILRDEIHRQNHRIIEDIDFKEFLRRFAGKGMLRPQTYWLKDFSGSLPLDYIGKFENLNESFSAICNAIGLKNTGLPHVIKGSSKNYSEFYDEEESTRIIEDIYREDIETFGYSFEN